MRTAEFERRYQRDGDPWGYASSEYERAKYDATLTACGPGPFASALELVREGVAEIHQKESFAPLYMRKRVGADGNALSHDTQENA